jgi:hypothetical protein
VDRKEDLLARSIVSKSDCPLAICALIEARFAAKAEADSGSGGGKDVKERVESAGDGESGAT